MTAYTPLLYCDDYLWEAYYSKEDILLMLDNVEVGPSEIHGIGAFAAKDIKEGDIVGFFHGPAWTGHGPNTHVYYAGEGSVSPFIVVGPLRLANHSDDPNMFVEEFEDHGPYSRPCATLFAQRGVARGEELTLDYGEDFRGQIKDV